MFLRILTGWPYRELSRHWFLWIFNESLGANVKVKLDLSSYARKTHLKEAAGVDTSDFSEKLI